MAALMVASPALAKPGLSLHGEAGRLSDDFTQRMGAGTTAQATWTRDEALDGQFSMLLEKSVDTASPSYAAAVVKHADGMTVAELGDIGFSVKGPCTGGSPRFNLSYDEDGDGERDGTKFYGCAPSASVSGDGWSTVKVAASSLAPADATVTSLSVLVDEQGTYYIDNVVVAGQTLGEPND